MKYIISDAYEKPPVQVSLYIGDYYGNQKLPTLTINDVSILHLTSDGKIQLQDISESDVKILKNLGIPVETSGKHFYKLHIHKSQD